MPVPCLSYWSLLELTSTNRRHAQAEWKKDQAKLAETHHGNNRQPRQPTRNNDKKRSMTSSLSDCNALLHLPSHQVSVTELHETNDVRDSSACVQQQEAFNTESLGMVHENPEPKRDEVFPDSLNSCGSIFGLVKEPLPDNVLCWKRKLLAHCTMYLFTLPQISA